MAVALVFGSYQKESELNVVKNSTIISLSVIFVAVLAGMMIFPMVYSFGLDVAEGPGLIFVVMPMCLIRWQEAQSGEPVLYCIFYRSFFLGDRRLGGSYGIFDGSV